MVKLSMPLTSGWFSSRRVGDELAADHLHEARRLARRRHAALDETQHRIGAVQREPLAAALEELVQRLGLALGGLDVAGIGDQHIAGGDRRGVGIIHRDARQIALVLGEELEELEPREIDVVILAGRHQMKPDRFGHARSPLCSRRPTGDDPTLAAACSARPAISRGYPDFSGKLPVQK
jgi:hypothetical protein